MKIKTILLVIVSTVFVSMVHLFFACVYHYATAPIEMQGLFDFSTWSHSYKRDVVGTNLFIVFFGVVACVVGNIQRVIDGTRTASS